MITHSGVVEAGKQQRRLPVLRVVAVVRTRWQGDVPAQPKEKWFNHQDDELYRTKVDMEQDRGGSEDDHRSLAMVRVTSAAMVSHHGKN